MRMPTTTGRTLGDFENLSGIHRLTADEYCELAERLAKSVHGKLPVRALFQAERTSNAAINRFTDVLTWVGNGQLRLVVEADHNGVYLSLYEGFGNTRAGEGLVQSWSIYQPTLVFTGALHATGRNQLAKVATSYNLSVKDPLTRHLPRYDADGMDAAHDIASKTLFHLLRHRLTTQRSLLNV